MKYQRHKRGNINVLWYKITEDNEVVLICKTTGKINEVEKEIKKIHSYEIPCILNFDVKENKKYGNWTKSIK